MSRGSCASGLVPLAADAATVDLRAPATADPAAVVGAVVAIIIVIEVVVDDEPRTVDEPIESSFIAKLDIADPGGVLECWCSVWCGSG